MAAEAVGRPAFERLVQRGFGRLVATSLSSPSSLSTRPTHLTSVSHRSPVRWIPLRNSAVAEAGASVCAMSNYGGGLLAGDSLEYDVRVESNATLGLVTQGSNRIYRTRRRRRKRRQGGGAVAVADDNDYDDDDVDSSSSSSRSSFRAAVDAGGLLVLAPDPVTPFGESRYEQEQSVTLLHPDASLCLVDWFSAGRVANGERWEQDVLRNRTVVSLLRGEEKTTTTTKPILMDCQDHSKGTMTHAPRTNDDDEDYYCWGMDWKQGGDDDDSFRCNAYASLVLYGERVEGVVERCKVLEKRFMEPYTSVRRQRQQGQETTSTTNDDGASSSSSRHGGDTDDGTALSSSLSGRIFLGVSEVGVAAAPPYCIGSTTTTTTVNSPPPRSRCLHVARFASARNEDLYKAFHFCLQPLKTSFGMEFYRDRIRAVHPSPVRPPYASTPTTTSATAKKDPTSRTKSTATKHEPNSRHRVDDGTGAAAARPKTNAACGNKNDNGNDSVASNEREEEQSKNKDAVFILDDNKYFDYNHHHLGHPADNASSPPSPSYYWTAFILADSALPAGSFAHSSGLEAASQLKLLQREDDVGRFAKTATHSSLRASAPLVVACHELAMEILLASQSGGDDVRGSTIDSFGEKWLAMDEYAQALLAGNGPACRASLDQGRSLLRVALGWVMDEDGQESVRGTSPSLSRSMLSKLQQVVDGQSDPGGLLFPSATGRGHLPCIHGAVTACLGLTSSLEACRLLGFCTARDVVSAAVRLNLVGPLAGVGLLGGCRTAAEGGILAGLRALERERRRKKSGSLRRHRGRQHRQRSQETDDKHDALLSAEAVVAAACAGSAPVLDAIHPCHDHLAVRLFRT